MIKTINVLNKEITEVDSGEFISIKKKTRDFIVSIPHSGLLVPVELKDKLNMGRSLLIGTDLFTNQVYDVDLGTSFIFNLNPYTVNVGRNKTIDQTKPLHLQTDPFHLDSLTGEAILTEEFINQEKKNLLKYYDWYHQLIEQAIQEMKKEHGFALLFDCHSLNAVGLPKAPDAGEKRADFVIGCLGGNSADPEIIAAFYKTLQEEADKFGWTVAKDQPYAGGYITQTYHDPKNQIQVLQLEIKKETYMDESVDSGNFKINLEGLQKVNSILSKAFFITSKEARKISTKPL